MVLRCNGDGLDGDVYRGLGELPDRDLGVFVFIDAGPGVGGDIVAAQKAGLRLDAEADDQLMTPVADAAVIGDGTVARTEVVKKVWDYVKANNLQDPKDKRVIVADAKLLPVFGKERVGMFEITGLVGKHLLSNA